MALNVSIRPATPSDEPFLREMQYEALYVPPGEPDFPADVVDSPGLIRYYRGFGTKPGDVGRIASSASEGAVGAAWVRQFSDDDPGYGYVDAATPELGIAVVAARRGEGVGTRLLASLLEAVPRCSLSVDGRNPALNLYVRFGFETIATDGNSFTMLRRGS